MTSSLPPHPSAAVEAVLSDLVTRGLLSPQYEVGVANEPGARLMTVAGVRPTAEPGCYNAETTLDLGSLEAGRVVRPLELLPKPCAAEPGCCSTSRKRRPSVPCAEVK